MITYILLEFHYIVNSIETCGAPVWPVQGEIFYAVEMFRRNEFYVWIPLYQAITIERESLHFFQDSNYHLTLQLKTLFCFTSLFFTMTIALSKHPSEEAFEVAIKSSLLQNGEKILYPLTL